MKILRLDPSLYLLWAARPPYRDYFEVSRDIKAPLQPRCATSPWCPQELLESPGEPVDPLSEPRLNPDFDGPHDCPYDFTTKSACYEDINIRALRAGLFPRRDVVLVGNFLTALAYRVETERVPVEEIDGSRILLAHRGDERDCWYELGPQGIGLRFAAAKDSETVRGDPFPWQG